MKTLFAAIIVILFAGSATALAEVAYFAGEKYCPGTYEQEVLVLTAISADYDGQLEYEWNQPMPGMLGRNDLQNAVFVVSGDGGLAELHVNGKFPGQFGIGNFDAPMFTSLMSSDRFGTKYTETLREGDNDVTLRLLQAQPSIKQGDVVASFAGTVCSTELASTLGGVDLGEIPVDVPEFSTGVMVMGGLGAVGLLFVMKR